MPCPLWFLIAAALHGGRLLQAHGAALRSATLKQSTTAKTLRLQLQRSSPPHLPFGRFNESIRYRQHVFTCQVKVGDHLTVEALVDTGSGNFVVPSSGCRSPGCVPHRRFRPEEEASGRFVPGFSDVSLSYATGRVEGSGFETRLCMGGACGRTRLLVAASESDEFRQYPFDAILGLGLPRQALGPRFNVIEALAKQGVLPSQTFALSLRASGMSAISLGLEPKALNASGLAWLPADARHGEWALPLRGIRAEGSGALAGACTAEGGCRAILDSGCAGIALPAPAARSLLQRLDLGDCSASALAALPKLSFAFGEGLSFDVPPSHYVEVSDVDASKCRPLVEAIDGDGALTRTVILGQPFLMDRHVVFDQGQMRIGIMESLSAL